jgi:hypothetical protein
MNDIVQGVSVAAFGHGFEEVPANEVAAVGHTCIFDQLASVFDDVRQVEEDAA